jgi:hypothetical protein
LPRLPGSGRQPQHRPARHQVGKRDAQGAWTVEPVELHRVFPPAEALPKAVPWHAQADDQADALVAELRAQLAEMRSQRDAWQAIAESKRRQPLPEIVRVNGPFKLANRFRFRSVPPLARGLASKLTFVVPEASEMLCYVRAGRSNY